METHVMNRVLIVSPSDYDKKRLLNIIFPNNECVIKEDTDTITGVILDTGKYLYEFEIFVDDTGVDDLEKLQGWLEEFQNEDMRLLRDELQLLIVVHSLGNHKAEVEEALYSLNLQMNTEFQHDEGGLQWDGEVFPVTVGPKDEELPQISQLGQLLRTICWRIPGTPHQTAPGPPKTANGAVGKTLDLTSSLDTLKSIRDRKRLGEDLSAQDHSVIESIIDNLLHDQDTNVELKNLNI